MTLLEGPEAVAAPSPRHMSTWSESELVAGCREGRREAFDALVSVHYDRIHRLAWSLAVSELTTPAQLSQNSMNRRPVPGAPSET